MDSAGQDEFVGDSAESTSNAYNPAKFYTSARDKKGFSTTARVNLPPSVLAGIGEFIAKQRIPEYRTTADFIRDAIVHRLVWLGENANEIQLSSFARTLIVETHSERYLREQEGVKRTLDSYENALRMAGREDQVRLLGEMTQDLRLADNTTLRAGLQALINRYT